MKLHSRLLSPAEASLQKRIPASLCCTQGIRSVKSARHLSSMKPLVAKDYSWSLGLSFGTSKFRIEIDVPNMVFSCFHLHYLAQRHIPSGCSHTHTHSLITYVISMVTGNKTQGTGYSTMTRRIPSIY